jgi:hypothetical protein
VLPQKLNKVDLMIARIENVKRGDVEGFAGARRNGSDTERFVFCATVSAKMRGVVEALFFFNPRQALLHTAISATVERTGIPKILELDCRLWIDVPSRDMQCLFACDSYLKTCKPVGVVLYERPKVEILSISHLAVNPEYAFRGGHLGAGLGLLLIERVKEIARRIKGVTHVQLPYRNQCFLRVWHPQGESADS